MTTVQERPAELAAPSPRGVREQVRVAGGQVAAGAGNLVFSLIAARLLAPGGLAQLAAFLALYLVAGLPATSISAAAALDSPWATRAVPRLARGSLLLAASIAISSPWLSGLLRLPVGCVLALAASIPSLALLALERGRLYGSVDHNRLMASLATEPVVRLTLGSALCLLAGPLGAAIAVTLAGYAALVVARRRRRASGLHWPGLRPLPASGAGADEATVLPAPGLLAQRTVSWALLGFLALALLQYLSLLIANSTLDAHAAGEFAVVSTLGGLAAFATLTVPLVMLPRTAAGEPGAVRPALLLTAVIGGASVMAVAADPHLLISVLFGSRYADIGGVVVAYVTAMSLLGVVRVLVAHRCATGRGRSTFMLLVPALVLQAALIVGFGRSVTSMAMATFASVCVVTATLGVAEALDSDGLRKWANDRAALIERAEVALRGVPRLVWVSTAVGIAVRAVVVRGLWLDEATSVYQARMPYGAMLTNLRTTDVHPPLYFTVLWATLRVFGSGETAVRLPSIGAGALVVPLLYLLGKEAFDKRTGVIAAVVGSVAPLMVWYSQEARMYAVLMLFGVIAMWAQLRILKSGGRWPWVVFALASAAMVWTQYFGALQLVVQEAVFALVWWNRRNRGQPIGELVRAWIAASVAIVALVAPLVPFAFQQFVVNQTGGKGFGGPQQVGTAATLHQGIGVYGVIANFIWAIWGYHSAAIMALIAALWPLGMLFALGLLGRGRQASTTVLLACILVPGAALFALGLLKRDLFDIRYLSTAVPLLLVLLARMASAFPRRATASLVAASLLVATLCAGLIDQQTNGTNPRLYAFRAAMQLVREQGHPGDAVLYDPVDLREVVLYYAAPSLSVRALGPSPLEPTSTSEVFVIASPSLMNGASDVANLAHALGTLRAHGHQVEDRRLSNVELWGFVVPRAGVGV